MGIVVGIALAAKAVRLGGMSFPLIHRQAAATGSSNTANPRLGPSALKQGCPRSLSQTSDSWLIPEPGDGGGDAGQWQFSPTHLLGSRLQRRCRVPRVSVPHQAKCPEATAGAFVERVCQRAGAADRPRRL
jgi:hypothetical protein